MNLLFQKNVRHCGNILSPKHHLGDSLDGPFEPSVARLRTYYLQDMVVRIKPSGAELSRVKKIIRASVDKLSITEGLTGVRVAIDVDPY